MSIINIQEALEHVRADEDDQAEVSRLLAAAERASATFLQRNLYADADQLSAARSEVAGLRESIRQTFEQAYQLAWEIDDLESRALAINDAHRVRADGLRDCAATARGMVITPDIAAACLLTLGHLYANREDVVTGTIATKLPFGARMLLDPYRVGLGV